MRLIVGSFDSRVAMMQTEIIINQLLIRHPDIKVEHKTFAAPIDQMVTQCVKTAANKNDKNTEIDRALLDGSIDFVVRSLKDIPLEVSKELPIVAYTDREDARDCLLLREGISEVGSESSLIIGTSSRRRRVQLSLLYKSCRIKEIHGELLSRIHRMERGEYDAIIVAASGVKRAGLTSRIAKYFEEEEVVPAAGQGILAIQARKDSEYPLLHGLNKEASEIAANAERSYIKALGGTCKDPAGAYGCVKNNKLYLTGMYYSEETGRCYKESVIGFRNEAEKLGIFFANYMKRRYRT